MANYARAVADPNFRDALVNTVLLLVTLPIWIMLPMLLAILIHQGVPGGRFYRAVFFLPAVLSSVIVGAIFNVVLRYDGSLNAALESIGISPVDWLGSSSTALGSLIAVQLWSTFGMSVLIFLAGLSTVPDDIIEAARMTAPASGSASSSSSSRPCAPSSNSSPWSPPSASSPRCSA